MRDKVVCPYCNAVIEVKLSTHVDAERAEQVVCNKCHRPIALYKHRAQALLHTERSVKAISLEDARFSEDSIYLEFLENEFAPSQSLRVPEGKSILGRFNPQSTADMQLMTSDPSMDRNHSVLLLNNKGWLTIMDNDSMTGTFVNGLELDPGERRRLSDGDVLTLGATSVIVHLGGDEDEMTL